MSNKKEDYDLRGADAVEKDPFLGRRPAARRPQPTPWQVWLDKIDHSPGASILAYCLSSISMTVVNKYVVSGSYWNLNFFYLAVQVCQTKLEGLREQLVEKS